MNPGDVPQDSAQSHRPRKPGPQRSLRVDEIARTAVRIADSRGVDAVTMRSLAAEFGVTAAALYRYFPSRDALMTHMIDAASVDVRYPEPSGRPIEDVIAVAQSQREVFAAHPWLGPAVSSHAELGPIALDHLEKMLERLAPLDAGTREKMETIGLVSALAAAFANTHSTTPEMEALSADRHPILSALRERAEPERAGSDLFPRAIKALATGLLGVDGP